MNGVLVIAAFALLPGLFMFALARLGRQHLALWITIFTALAAVGSFVIETMGGVGMFRYVLTFGLMLPATVGSILGLFIGAAPWKKAPHDPE